ncbi:hypothetical protein [Zooshikella sp. RANM57]|uniref:hypothetical protein n=1 Tax=Zooshikella sp. RANM57 TaxID=3425863 RepID=UPI003D6E0697
MNKVGIDAPHYYLDLESLAEVKNVDTGKLIETGADSAAKFPITIESGYQSTLT